MKKPTNQGQLFLNAVEAALEPVLEHSGKRPLGMPPYTEIETELKRLGYGKVDAESIYDYWLSNGFKMGGRKVLNWRACVRNMIRYRKLPSQCNPAPGLIEHRKEKPAQLEEARRDRRKVHPEATEEERQRAAHALRQWRKSQ